jgi:hypothetical protein
MDAILEMDLSSSEVRMFNNWRNDYQVNYLTETIYSKFLHYPEGVMDIKTVKHLKAN